MDMKKVIGAGLVGLAIGAATVGVHDVLETPDTEIRFINQTEIIEVPVEVIKEVNVTQVEYVDNENLDLVLNEIYDNNGEVEYLIDDLDDDELDQVVARIVFANDVKAMAVAEAKKEIVDLLHKEVINGTTLDEDDIERVKVQGDDDEVVIADIDYEDLDADVEVEIKFEQDDVEYVALVEVEVKENEVDDIDLISINLR